MKKIALALLIVTALTASLWTASAQQQTPAPTQKSTQQLSPEELIKRFTAKESELNEIWKEYQYLQESKIQTIGQANTVTGEFYQVSEFVFNDAGKRLQKIIKAPVSDLETSGVLTYEDKNALTNLQPFALTTQDLPLYNVSYVGKEKVDDLNTYVFDVTPKVMSNERELKKLKDQKVEGKFFQGRIWVDDEDLQVVKSAGKVVPEFKQRFPKFETYRENIDGRYWFPTYTYGDDKLYFDKGGMLHVRLVVKYKNYRRFQSDIKFIDGAEVVDDPKSGEVKPGEAKKEEPKKEDPKAKPTPTPRPRPRP
ncbi:MAG: hypothetical protein SF097_24675 [Acidobacteriota bacterium]|nr:hypothetical protein [Acidobacteriota bacterium]